MGLDIGFYKQDETEVHSFRNHRDLAEWFFTEPSVGIEPYSDFYVTRPMITAILAKIEAEMQDEGLTLDPLPVGGSAELWSLVKAIPDKFYECEPEDWPMALPTYRILLTDMLEEIHNDGCLICGWSA